VAAAVIAAIVIANSGGGSEAASVRAQPVNSVGSDPYTPPAVPRRARQAGYRLRRPTVPHTTDGRTVPVSGSAPGLYGGSNQMTVCDKKQLVDSLEADPVKGRAWAGVEGIRPGGIRGYVAALTDVVLQADTRVTNHGFRNGSAYPIDDVLQAGTAVMIDRYGVPRVRCYCGNPLTPARPLAAHPTVTGTRWPGFNVNDSVEVRQTQQVNQFIEINVADGRGELARKPGAQPQQATPVTSSPPAPNAPPGTTAQLPVPDERGEMQDFAVATLQSAGFSVQTQQTPVTSPDADGVVTDQSPVGGTAPRGSTVTITVGSYQGGTTTTTPGGP
jgi:hypothetical protein